MATGWQAVCNDKYYLKVLEFLRINPAKSVEVWNLIESGILDQKANIEFAEVYLPASCTQMKTLSMRMVQGWLTMLDSRCAPQLLGDLRKEDKLVMSKLLYYALGGAAEEKLQVTMSAP